METQQDKLLRILDLRKLFTTKKWAEADCCWYDDSIEIQFTNNKSDFVMYTYPDANAAILGQQRELSYDIEKFFTGMEYAPREYLDELREVLSGE